MKVEWVNSINSTIRANENVCYKSQKIIGSLYSRTLYNIGHGIKQFSAFTYQSCYRDLSKCSRDQDQDLGSGSREHRFEELF